METTIDLLKSYGGRDKLMRTVGYVAMLLSGAGEGQAAKKLGTLSRQISGARVVLRLFDDLPMIAHSLNYGTGAKERDGVMRVLNVLSNVFGTLYFPIEHIAWAADNEIVQIKSTKWWKAGIACWACSLTIGILKNLRTLGVLRYKRGKLLKQKKLESPVKGDTSSSVFEESMVELAKKERLEFLMLIKSTTDLLNAVNWLPEGFLWAGRFNTAQSGLFGTIASIAGLMVLVNSSK